MNNSLCSEMSQCYKEQLNRRYLLSAKVNCINHEEGKTCNQKMLFLGIFSSLTFTTALASVTFMAVPDALCIVFACPVVTIFLSAIFLGDKLTVFKIIAGFQLLVGVILVCKPPFLFGDSTNTTVGDHESYYIGVLLAVTACLSGGSMNVMVSTCKHVSSNILVSWSAVSGVIMSVIYCLSEGTSSILSNKIYDTTCVHWATLGGEYSFEII